MLNEGPVPRWNFLLPLRIKNKQTLCTRTEIHQSQMNVLLECLESFGYTLFDFPVWQLWSIIVTTLFVPLLNYWIHRMCLNWFLSNCCTDMIASPPPLPPSTRMKAPRVKGLCRSCSSVSRTVLHIEWVKLYLTSVQLCCLCAPFIFSCPCPYLVLMSTLQLLWWHHSIHSGAGLNRLCHYFSA